MARLRAPSSSLRRGKPLRTRVLACSAALAVIILMAVPGSRSFASGLATKIVHLRPGAAAGPIPFILDLHKHKRAQKTPAPVRHGPTGQRTDHKTHAAAPVPEPATAPVSPRR